MGFTQVRFSTDCLVDTITKVSVEGIDSNFLLTLVNNNFLDEDQNRWMLELLEKALKKYKLDSTVCTQKIACFYVKKSKSKVLENRGNKLDKFINGLTR